MPLGCSLFPVRRQNLFDLGSLTWGEPVGITKPSPVQGVLELGHPNQYRTRGKKASMS